MKTVKCPECGKDISFDKYDECFDMSLSFSDLEGWAYLGFVCDNCKAEFEKMFYFKMEEIEKN